MSRSTANVSFYCRESKKNKDGLAPIEMVIILNTRRCFIQLPRKEYPSQFKARTHLCYQVPEQRDTLGGGSKTPWSQHNQNNTALC